MDDLQQFKDTYITECYELLQEMEELLLNLDEENADLEELNAIFRCAHSIKGGAGAFGFTRIASFTHILEALLDSMREGKVPASRDAVDALLKSVDIVTQLVQAAQSGEEADEGLGAELEKELLSIAADGGKEIEAPAVKTAPSENTETTSDEVTIYDITFTPYVNLFNSGNEPLLILRELRALGETTVKSNIEKIPDICEIHSDDCYISWNIELETTKSEESVKEVFEFVEDECNLSINVIGAFSKPPAPEQIAAEPQQEKAANSNTPLAEAEKSKDEKAPKAPAASTSIRVDVDKVDRLVNMVGELVITQAMLSAQTRDLPIDEFQGLLDGMNALSQHTRELQESVMSVRMQPVKSIFSRMPRIVRDLSTQLNKDIRIETFGENTEVDKTLIEQLSDPLTHMIRNSIDHGIEKPEDRVAAGKPAQGVISLGADHRGGRIVIEISDDGAGINREKVLERAIERELVPPDATLSNEEIDHLVFMPGFSTAETVTNISGRGVGMDVVKRNINSLGGSVEIRNNPGKGSNFTVSLPLTLAILDGMIVRAGKEFYIIPIMSIVETMRPKPKEVKKLADNSDIINVRGQFIPVLYLHECFDIQDAEPDPSKALVVLVENNRQSFGIVVDELVGQQQVVIKSLTENADPVRGISGATILGDGKVSLILDIGELHKILNRVAVNYKNESKTISA